MRNLVDLNLHIVVTAWICPPLQSGQIARAVCVCGCRRRRGFWPCLGVRIGRSLTDRCCDLCVRVSAEGRCGRQGQMRHTDARMSLYYGKVIPASVRQEVNKLVDQMQATIEKHAEKAEQTEVKTRRIG
jgi:hypothetical protein